MVHISFWFVLMMLIFWVKAHIYTISKNTEILLVAIEEIGLEVNVERIT
jgi:hypothetical protein